MVFVTVVNFGLENASLVLNLCLISLAFQILSKQAHSDSHLAAVVLHTVITTGTSQDLV